jgi:alkylmercury lyase
MAAFITRMPACQDQAGTWRTALRLLSDGRSVPAEDLAAATGNSAARLRRNPLAEWSADGQLIGLGLTLRPTHQHLKVAGRDLYAWSALDPLLLTHVLGKRIQVTTSCRATGTTIRLDVTSAAVLLVDPPDVTMSVPSHPEAPDHRLPSFCAHLNFFRSAQAASAWLRDHPGYEVLAITDALSFAGHLDSLLTR